MADWMPPSPSPSPQTLFSSMLGDNIGSRTVSESTNEGDNGFSFHGYTDHITNSNHRDEPQAHSAIDQTTGLCAMSKQNISSHGGLLERMAARAGFNAPRLNTETIRSTDLSSNQEARSPYFTIPPGFSPTTLLESPVFVSNSLAQPSPTTGKFSYVPPSGASESAGLFTEFADRNNDNIFGSLDSFRHGPSQFFGSSDKESFQFPSIEVSVQSENTIASRNLEQSKAVVLYKQEDSCILEEQGTTTTGSVVLEHSSPLDEQQDDKADQGGGGDVNGVESPVEDGFNWRKYGQKQVKGSDFPRSYYKCTDTNCPVKKKIERSMEGHIIEIIYRGIHNHPKPHRRSSASFGDIQLENGQCGFTGGGGNPVWRNVERGNMAASDWRNDNLDVMSSTMFGSQYGNGTKSIGNAADGSSTLSNDEDEDDRGTQGSASLVDDGGGDESESKKRKVEAYAADMSGASRGMREPRVVVQTTSEVDILDDGYRWRKYGQKVVKGNPNPRSYYKCTSPGCSVRKHVERASHDLKSVITTYEGKHNHDVPAARNSSHVNSGSNVATQVLKPEPSQVRNSMSQVDRNASFGSFGLPNRPLLIPPQDFGYGMTQRNLPNLALLGGWGGPNHNHNHNHNHQDGLGLGLPFLQGHRYPGQQPQQQQRVVSEMELVLPKAEPMGESGTSLPNASSIYQQVMNRMPLGPHM